MQNNLNYSTNIVRVDLTKVTDGGLNLSGIVEKIRSHQNLDIFLCIEKKLSPV